MKKRASWILVIILITLIAAGVSIRAIVAGRSQTNQNVQTVTVTRGNVTVTAGEAGTVRSNQSALVAWESNGKVGSISAQMGQTVQAGEELAALDPNSPSLLQAQVNLINAQIALDDLKKPQSLKVAQAQAALADAQTALDKLLHPSQADLSQARMAVINAQTAVNTAQTYVNGLPYNHGSQEQIAAAQAAYLVAKNQVAQLQKAYHQIRGDPAKNPAKALALSRLDAAITQRERALANLNWLSSKAAQAEMDQKMTALALAQGQLADAQASYQKLISPTPEEIALARAAVEDDQQKLDDARNSPSANDVKIAESQLALAQATVDQAHLTAPFAGTITAVDVMRGDLVSAGQTAFRIDDLSKLFVDVQVSEVDVPNIEVGQAATLTFDAIPNHQYHGKVTEVGMVGAASQGVVNYPVTVQITDPDQNLKPGMTAAVNILIAEHDDVLIVPNQAIHTIRNQHMVTVLFEGQQIQIPVTIGLTGDVNTEVTGNTLKEGDEVVISSSPSAAANLTGGGGNFRGPGFLFNR